MKFYNARFLTWWERQKILKKKHRGITIDGRRSISLKQSFTHTMITAGSGMGKSSTILIPTLLRMKGASCVVTDPSGELATKTGAWLQSQGFEVQVLNVLSPEESIQFNPLTGITTEAEIAEISDVLIQTVYGSSTGEASFWNESASSLLTVILCMLLPESEYFNLANARHLLNLFGLNGGGILPLAEKNLSAKMQTEFLGIISKEAKVLTSIVATATAALKIFGNSHIATISAGQTIDPWNLRSKPTVLFLQCPEDRMSVYAPYLALVYYRILSGAGMAHKPTDHEGDWLPIHFLLDEFGNTFIPGFDRYVTTLRKRQCSLTLLLQDPAQLEVYGRHGMRTIMSNMYSKLWMGGLDIRTCQLIEQTMGKTMKKRGKEEKSPEQARSLMTADEIRTMGRNRALFVQNDTYAARLTLKPYFKQRRLRKRILPFQGRKKPAANAWKGYIEIPKVPSTTPEIDFS